MKNFLFVLCVVFMSACATPYTIQSANQPYYKQATSASNIKYEAESRYTEQGQLNEGLAEPTDRYVTYNAQVDLDPNDPDSVITALFAIAANHGGYLLNMDPTSGVIRVKSSELRAALDDLGTLGVVKSEEIDGQDVTDQFLDLEIRLENAQKARKRYLELLDKVNSIQDGIALERELERLNREIDLLSGQLQQMEHKITYATVTVYYRDRPKPGLLSYVGLGMYKATRWLFVRG